MGEDSSARAPEGTVARIRTEWADASTGRVLNQHERAVAFVKDYLSRTGEWPGIKAVKGEATVGTGTAWRAISKVRREFDLASTDSK